MSWTGRYFMTDEIKKKISLKLKGRKLSKTIINKMKKNRVGMTGKKHSFLTKQKISKKKIGCKKCGGYSFGRGHKNPNWNDGSSFKPYSTKWTKELKDYIRKRDNYKCQICNNNAKIVHHINYNKLDCRIKNLIVVCNSCHSKTNTNRVFWIKYFKQKGAKNVLD